MMRVFIGLLVTCTLLVACKSSPGTTYHLLNATERNVTQANVAVDEVIGLGPIEIAEYLQRLPLVYLNAAGQPVVSTTHYWAEPLDKGIARVLSLNLTAAHPGRSVAYFPWRADSKPHYSVRINIQSLDHDGSKAHINATWELVNNDEKQVVARHRYQQAVNTTPGAASMADAYSQLLASLASEIDRVLIAQP